jgi:hypothetical protein
MGWVELEESQVAPHNMTDTIAECISNLARERKDLWKTPETWGGVSIKRYFYVARICIVEWSVPVKVVPIKPVIQTSKFSMTSFI